MVFASYEKPGVPVARAKLNDLLVADNKNHKFAKKLLARTLPEAQVGRNGQVVGWAKTEGRFGTLETLERDRAVDQQPPGSLVLGGEGALDPYEALNSGGL